MAAMESPRIFQLAGLRYVGCVGRGDEALLALKAGFLTLFVL